MIGSDILLLLATEYEVDALGQKVPKETKREVFCRVQNVSQTEFFEAGRLGFKPELKATLAASQDYQGEALAEYDGDRYAIYRTYKTDYDEMELYLRRETGAL